MQSDGSDNPPAAGRVPKVLLVDDETGILKALQRLMRRHRIKTVAEDCPIAALERLADVAPDVIVSDHRMPRMNGVEFLRRAREIWPTASRLLLSGQADRDVLIEAVNDGAISRFMDKPWNDDTLIQAIRHAAADAIEAERQARLETDVSEFRGRLTVMSQALDRERHSDLLTGLLNRGAFIEQVDGLLCQTQARLAAASGEARNASSVAILVLGVSGVELIRASEGLEGADRLLGEVANSMRMVLRDEDALARLGDDQFAVLLRQAGSADSAQRVALRLLAELEQPNHRPSGIWISAAVGVVCASATDVSAASLIANAQTALDLARSQRQRIKFYTPGMSDEAHYRLRLERRLRNAIASGSFELHFQPRFRARDRQIVAAEALLRWHDAELGQVGPAQFIPVLEETGLIVEVGRWVVQEAAKTLARLRRAGYGGLAISVNVSALQFRFDDIERLVMDALAAVGEEAHRERLELEITETLLIGEQDKDLRTLRHLVDCGTPIAMDDFGTGYSSLSYLVKLPFHVVKIDRQFVSQMDVSEEMMKVVQTIISMAHGLNMRVVAEGVETEAQAQALARLSCDELQGFLLARPMSEPAFRAFLDSETQQHLASSRSLPASFSPENRAP